MAGFNWVDIIILLLVAAACYYGFKLGFLRLLFVFTGFFGTLFLAGWLLPHVLPFKNSTPWTIINGNIVFILAVYVAFRGYDLAKRFHYSLKGKYHAIESAAGVILSVVSTLLAIWLIAAGIGSMPFAGLSNSVNDAYFVQALDRNLPSVPSVFAGVGTLVDPNSAPGVFVKKAPNSSLGSSRLPRTTPAVIKAGNSVVRITSFGCGGVISGSGFAIAPDLIATNAHVIAGVKRPIIKYGTRSYEGVPVLFDPNLDMAILKVGGLNVPPLDLLKSDLSTGSKVYVIGYPESNYAILPGINRNKLSLFGTNIYGVGSIARDVYEIQAAVQDGNSGGPLITPDGRVAGMMFAKSDLVDNYGYALTSSSLIDAVTQAKTSAHRVGNGICFRD